MYYKLSTAECIYILFGAFKKHHNYIILSTGNLCYDACFFFVITSREKLRENINDEEKKRIQFRTKSKMHRTIEQTSHLE